MNKPKLYKYDEIIMQAAIESVRGGMSKKAAAAVHDVPRPTLNPSTSTGHQTIEYKKKMPAEKMPSMISSLKFRKYLAEKAEKKMQNKSIKDK